MFSGYLLAASAMVLILPEDLGAVKYEARSSMQSLFLTHGCGSRPLFQPHPFRAFAGTACSFSPLMQEKIEHLKATLHAHAPLVIAYSGGVDSACLLAVAHE